MIFILRLLKKLMLLERINFVLTYPEDRSIKIPVIKSLGFNNFFEPESWLTMLLKKLIIPNNDCFIDVGVNVGQTLLKVKSLNRSIQYFGFEPNPNCLFYLYELLRCNAFVNTTILPFALSDETGVMDLNLYSDSATDSSASIVPAFRNKRSTQIKVPVFNGAEVLQLGTHKAGIVKIDVEGGELEVIKGVMPVLRRDRPIIICEVLPVYEVSNTQRLARQEELESLIKSLQYQLSLIDATGTLRLIDSIGIHSDINRINYLFFPKEKREELNNKVNLQ